MLYVVLNKGEYLLSHSLVGCSDSAVTGAAAVSLLGTVTCDRDHESEPWGDVIFQEGRTAG